MRPQTTILVVDDEHSFVEGLKANLEREGYRCVAAYDGEAALETFAEGAVDLVLLDLMLPGVDGMEVCRRIRTSSTVPIIMLTARDDDIDKILGLEVGADDYLTKPFNFRELLARVKAVMRRVHSPGSPGAAGGERLQITGRVHLDVDRQALEGDESVPLTVKEFGLLELLARHPGRVFSREELLDRVWGYDYYGSSRTVDVHVRRVRKKLETSGTDDGSEVIRTRWGAGYYMQERVRDLGT